MRRVLIIGGGIAGLSAAYHLQANGRNQIKWTLLERSPRLGGKIVSARHGGFLVEGGPDSFIVLNPSVRELARDLGIEDQIIPANAASRSTFLWSDRKLRKVPEDMILMLPSKLLPFLRSSLISWKGKVRMSMEPFIGKRQEFDDESIADFVRRRLGTEMLAKLAGPLMAGIFAGDPEKLSLRSTFPRFAEIEQRYGSLLRGMLAQRRQQQKKSSKGTSPTFFTFRKGMQQLVDTLVERLDRPSLRTDCHVVAIDHLAGKYQALLANGERIAADEIILASPADVTARLVEPFSPALATMLHGIRYCSSATVSLGFKAADIRYPINGAGFLVAHHESRRILGCTWSSSKFPQRASDDCVLLRAFIGGAKAEHLAECDDATLLQIAREELATTMGIEAAPILQTIYRWPKGNPQYEVGHSHRIEEIQRLVSSYNGLHLAGAAYRGPGIPNSIQSGREAAKELLNKLSMSDHNRTFALEAP